MKVEKTNESHEEAQLLLRNLVERFPLGCVCFQPVFNKRKEIINFAILYINARLETILRIPKDTATGKMVKDSFGLFSEPCIRHLMKLTRDAYGSNNPSCEANISIYGHIYKASSLFIGKEYLLCFMEDIQARYFRRHYQRAIPRDIVTTILAESKAGGKERTPAADAGPVIDFTGERKPLEILHPASDAEEPGDTVFRDSLTGLYDRYFAMEALRMYVDHQVLPMSIVLGDINGLRTINESLGYDAGDEILVKIARVLNEQCRSDDIVARWNDGEFMILLPYASQEDTRCVIRRLENKLNTICGVGYHIVTFGYAVSDYTLRVAEDLIREAEKWVYRKKLLIDQSHRSSVIRLLLSILHEKSAETEEHSDRLAYHCRCIAKKMNLSDEMLDDLILLSMLHDIGKVCVPDSILNKPGALTDEERKIINCHPDIGYRIAQTVPELKQVSAYILAHHERWDGTGYPNALREGGIPIASRILAVVDAFDVMITGRKYRAPRTKEEAIAELQRCSGTQFDPDIVAIYIKLLLEDTDPQANAPR